MSTSFSSALRTSDLLDALPGSQVANGTTSASALAWAVKKNSKGKNKKTC